MAEAAPQVHYLGTSEERNVAVSFVGKLDGAEVLTGTPVVTEVTTSALTLSSKQVSSAELEINRLTVAIGMAVQFKVSAADATVGQLYTAKIVCGTDAGQTVSGLVKFRIT